MTVVYVYVGKANALEWIMTLAGSMQLRLFQNNLTPDNDTVIGDFDECDFSGYAGVTPTWGGIIENGDGNAQSTGLLGQFVHDGGGTPNDVYGWYLVTNVGGAEQVMFTERFADAPRVLSAIGDEIDITPQMIQGDCP